MYRTRLVILLLLLHIPTIIHAQADMEIPFEYETYTYLEDDLTFEYPAGWTVAAQRSRDEFRFTVTSMSRDALYPSGTVISSPEDMLIVGHIASFGSSATAYWIEQYAEVAQASCPDGVNVEACAVYIGEATQFAEWYLGFIPVMPPETETPEITQLDNGFLVVSLATDPDWVLLYTVVRGAKISAATSPDHAPALLAILEHLANTIQLDVDALITHRNDLPTVPQQNAELGPNGFEVWGPINRAVVVTDAAWLSEPSFITTERTQQDTFDFYVTSDPQNALEASYVWFQNVPLDIQPGIIDSYIGRVVTFKDGERLNMPMEGVLTIESLAEGRISGNFEGLQGRSPAGHTLTHVVFSDVEIPDVVPCLASGTAGDDVSFIVNINGAGVDDTFDNGIWRLRTTDNYDLSLGNAEQDRLMLYFYQSNDPNQLHNGHYVGFEDIPVAAVTQPLSAEETERVVIARRYYNIDGRIVAMSRDSEITFTETGETLAGSFEVQQGSEDDETSITVNFPA